jgi:hypothetical protein
MTVVPWKSTAISDKMRGFLPGASVLRPLHRIAPWWTRTLVSYPASGGRPSRLLAQLDEDKVRRGSQFDRICAPHLAGTAALDHCFQIIASVRGIWRDAVAPDETQSSTRTLNARLLSPKSERARPQIGARSCERDHQAEFTPTHGHVIGRASLRLKCAPVSRQSCPDSAGFSRIPAEVLWL